MSMSNAVVMVFDNPKRCLVLSTVIAVLLSSCIYDASATVSPSVRHLFENGNLYRSKACRCRQFRVLLPKLQEQVSIFVILDKYHWVHHVIYLLL